MVYVYKLYSVLHNIVNVKIQSYEQRSFHNITNCESIDSLQGKEQQSRRNVQTCNHHCLLAICTKQNVLVS